MSNKKILKNISYIDVESGEKVENTNLIIEDGVIKEIIKEPFDFGDSIYKMTTDKSTDCRKLIVIQ